MSHPCYVPDAREITKTGPKVHVFNFPHDKTLCEKWLYTIKRKDFIPPKHSKVCHLHFEEQDFKQESLAYDEKTGKTFKANLGLKLNPEAVPSKLSNLPAYYLQHHALGKVLMSSEEELKKK